jgi:uncharacterized membrane protein
MTMMAARRGVARRGSSILTTVGYAILAIFIALFTLISSRYFTHDGDKFFPAGEFYENQTAKYLTYYVPFILHVGCGLTTMILGPFLIHARLRNRFLGAHRLLGKVYLAAAVVGAIDSFYFSFHVFGGLSPMLAGWVKAVLWLVAAVSAWVTIRRRDVKKHRVWVLRSYALAVEPIAFKLWTLGAFAFGVDPVRVMQVFAWISAASVIAGFELYIARMGWSKEGAVREVFA